MGRNQYLVAAHSFLFLLEAYDHSDDDPQDEAGTGEDVKDERLDDFDQKVTPL